MNNRDALITGDGMRERDRFRGCLLGLATGDAVGTTLEFKPRDSFAPVSDMAGGGPFGLAPGEWTDDTSMALCLASSLVDTGKFDPEDQMLRYCRWAECGYLSCNGRCFDIGNTVSAALTRYRSTGDPFAGVADPWSAGNGSIMRLAPIPMFYYPDQRAAALYAAESSRTTHGAAECLDACRLLAGIVVRTLAGRTKSDVLFDEGEFAGSPSICAVARGEYRRKAESQIRGSGYVVESLEAALWCFWRTYSFEAAILAAANLGDDADTTAAVCGQIAGAYYGESGIPASWLDRLAMREEIAGLADRLFDRTQQRSARH
jgi:ADP-ribosyl-[dinitrogen reductase] hydrolase